MKLSVIIPTLNAEVTIEKLLSALQNQILPPDEILIIDSSSTDRTAQIVERYPAVRFTVIPKASFNHGGTRDRAAREAAGDILLFMTQDAIPADDRLTETLVKALSDHPNAAAAYARQIPAEDANPREKLVRAFSYPEEPEIHDLSSVRQLGLRAYYCPNVCAAYRREAYFELGGFETDLRTNEDMLFAAKAIKAGKQIIYAANAAVVHSHNFTPGEQYRRNKLQGYELARHSDLLGDDSPVGSGKAMLIHVTRGLLKKGRFLSWIGFGFDCVARYAGNRAGKREYESGKGKNG